jgi:hypothetical protein
MVGTSENFEESLGSPIFIPRVGQQPVFNSVFNTPSHQFDGVSSQEVSGFVLIDTVSVRQEVLIDGEGGFDWAVGHEFGLDGGLS